MKKLLPWLLSILLFGSFGGFAQELQLDCSQALRLASATYDQGRLHELEGLLAPRLKEGQCSVAEKVAAYRFLILAYIYLEEPEKADATMLLLLQTDHYYDLNENIEPAEFTALYKTFRTREIYRLGIKLGANMCQPNLVSSNSATTGVTAYHPGYGFTGGIAGEIPIKPQLTFNPEIQFQLSTVSAKTDTNPEGFQSTTPQKLSYFSIPLAVQFEFGDPLQMTNKNKKPRPYILAGIAPDILFGGSRNTIENRPGWPQIPGSNVSSSILNKFNFSALAGAGVRLRVAGGYAVAEVRYKYGFKEVTNKGNTYANQAEVFGPKYADAIYKINALSLTVGYVHNFFNPKKLKHKK